MKLQIRVNEETGVVEEAVFKATSLRSSVAPIPLVNPTQAAVALRRSLTPTNSTDFWLWIRHREQLCRHRVGQGQVGATTSLCQQHNCVGLWFCTAVSDELRCCRLTNARELRTPR